MSLYGLKIISLNVNPIAGLHRKANLQEFVKAHNPDIMCLVETKLSVRHKLQFKEYNIIRTNRADAKLGGGTAILIRKTISGSEINLVNIDTKILESSTIKIKINASNSLYIISAYSPKSKALEIKEIFTQLELHKRQNYYLLTGDLNAKHKLWENRKQ